MELAAAVRVTRTISLAGGAHANHYNAKLAEMTRAERASALVDKFVDADDSTKSRFALAAGQGCALHHPMPCVWKSQHSTLGVETESHWSTGAGPASSMIATAHVMAGLVAGVAALSVRSSGLRVARSRRQVSRAVSRGTNVGRGRTELRDSLHPAVVRHAVAAPSSTPNGPPGPLLVVGVTQQ